MTHPTRNRPASLLEIVVAILIALAFLYFMSQVVAWIIR